MAQLCLDLIDAPDTTNWQPFILVPQVLMETEGITLEFEDAATRAIAKVAEEANRLLENIGECLSITEKQMCKWISVLCAGIHASIPQHHHGCPYRPVTYFSSLQSK